MQLDTGKRVVPCAARPYSTIHGPPPTRANALDIQTFLCVCKSRPDSEEILRALAASSGWAPGRFTFPSRSLIPHCLHGTMLPADGRPPALPVVAVVGGNWGGDTSEDRFREPMIHTENLTKHFGDTFAVENLNLDVAEGEVFGFLGPNGAGKTTTVRMLTCLIKPTSGSAMVNGFRVGRDDKIIRRTVGLLTETPGLYDRLSALHNLQIYASLYEIEDRAGQVEKYLRMLGLWERRHELAATFSKGMKQKLALARALMHEPRVLFLDEPTAALDPEAAYLVREFIAGLSREGRTIFVCTHNLDEADRLCDRIGVLKTRLLMIDTPERLRANLFGRQVVFRLQRADASIAQAVLELPFVDDCRLTDNELVVTVEKPELHNPQLIRLLVGLGVEVQFVSEVRRSLEEVYLQLMKEAEQSQGPH